MALDVVYGASRSSAAAGSLAELLRRSGEARTLYRGYPLPASTDDGADRDARLESQSHGLVAIFLEEAVPASDVAGVDARLLQGLCWGGADDCEFN